MTYTQQLKRRSSLGSWLLAGVLLGGSVLPALGMLLCLADSDPTAAQFLPVVVVFTGTLGAIGGGIAGAACALLTALLDRWTGGLPAAGYATVAATVTAAVATAFGLCLTGSGWTLNSSTVWSWFILPVAVSSAVAAVAGALLWRHAFAWD